MRLLATVTILSFYAVGFGLRSWWQWRATGRTGFVGVRAGAGTIERAAAGLLGLALVAAPIAPWLGPPLWTTGRVGGLALTAAAIVVTLLAQLQMGSSWRIGVDRTARTALITDRLFAVSRNPIFTGMVLGAVGVALTQPTIVALLVPPVLLLAVELQVRFVEEPYLRRAHGDAYRRWAARTGRFVPWLGRSRA